MLRAQYLFNLARLCHVKPGETGDLTLTDFAVCIDSIDEWLKIELQLRR